MVRFMVYLLETGICISLLFLSYWLLLRKETYFRFNRLFLVASIFLALAVPLVHLGVSIPAGSSLKDPARSIVKFRDYYEELIQMSNADFGREPGLRKLAAERQEAIREFEGRLPMEKKSARSGNSGKAGKTGEEQARLVDFNLRSGNISRLSLARILLLIYIIGVMYFFARFLYLVFRLFLLAMKNGSTRQEGFRMVEITQDISPFSFFRLLFINNRSFSKNELAAVLEHERAHIRQKHSLDHLLAHALAVFQWFNPFAWRIRTALKTTHEYIADRRVIVHCMQPADYQTLLLRQVLGYHSEELVNNFNLKPIKKRIAMMSKKPSGLTAKLKALLVIPFTLAVFLIFADFTLKGPGNRILDIRTNEDVNMAPAELNGLWVKQSEDEFSDLILFAQDRFSYNDAGNIMEYFWSVDNGALNLSGSRDVQGTRLKFKFEDDMLVLWWNDYKSSRYRLSSGNNSMDDYISRQEIKLSLPYISQFRLLENEKLLNRICLGYDHDGHISMIFNGRPAAMADLGKLVEKARMEVDNKLDMDKQTNMFLIDREISMSEIVKLKNELRDIRSLKVAYAGYPEGDLEVSALQYHTVALPMLLPPPEAKIMDKDEIEKSGTRIFTINLSDKNLTPADLDRNLEDFIQKNRDGRYVFSLEYDGSISYNQYLESVDIVFNVVYRFRKELAMSRFQTPYESLGKELQMEIRKAYPMVLSEAWNGM